MNLKERGVTVGDLVVISIIIISTFVILNKVNDKEKQINSFLNTREIYKTVIS
tara:strand:- start:280 stop:438 length:159 start_codon:yes stop_codon:yes gene_type:complete